MSKNNNLYASYPEYIDNQLELLVGSTNNKVQLWQETPDSYFKVDKLIKGCNMQYIDKEYKQNMNNPIDKSTLYNYPWKELKYDTAYYTS